MRTLLVVALATTGVLFRPASSDQQTDAAALVGVARQALGGDAALNGVTSFSVDGTLNRSIGGMSMADRFELSCVLPDRLLRVSRRPMGNGPLANADLVEYQGLNGTTPIFVQEAVNSPFPLPPPPVPGPTTPEGIAEARDRQLKGSRRMLIETVMPLFVAVPDMYGVQMTASVAPGNAADVINLKGADDAAWQLWLDRATHLPMKLTWKAKPVVSFSSTSVGSMRRGDSLPVPPVPTGDPAAGLAMVDWEMKITEYKSADGFTWPHRLTSSFDGKIFEDVRYGKFKINPKIDLKKFEKK